MEEPPRRQLPDSNAQYRDRCFWESRYRVEGSEPAEWFGGLECFREQLEAELKPGDRILVLDLHATSRLYCCWVEKWRQLVTFEILGKLDSPSLKS